jgi:hypothetical protein
MKSYGPKVTTGLWLHFESHNQPDRSMLAYKMPLSRPLLYFRSDSASLSSSATDLLETFE